jgi:hypothetical protein
MLSNSASGPEIGFPGRSRRCRCMAALLDGCRIFKLSRIGDRSFWGSGWPRGPKVGGEAPTFWKSLRGPRGRPDPQITDFRPSTNLKFPPKGQPRKLDGSPNKCPRVGRASEAGPRGGPRTWAARGLCHRATGSDGQTCTLRAERDQLSSNQAKKL